MNNRIRTKDRTRHFTYMDLLAEAKEQGNTDKLFWLRIACPYQECLQDIFLTFRVVDGDMKIEYSSNEPKEDEQWLRSVPPRILETLKRWRDVYRYECGELSRKQDPDFWEMFDAIEAELERRKIISEPCKTCDGTGKKSKPFPPGPMNDREISEALRTRPCPDCKDKKTAQSVSSQKKGPFSAPYPQGTRYGLVKRLNLK